MSSFLCTRSRCSADTVCSTDWAAKRPLGGVHTPATWQTRKPPSQSWRLNVDATVGQQLICEIPQGVTLLACGHAHLSLYLVQLGKARLCPRERWNCSSDTTSSYIHHRTRLGALIDRRFHLHIGIFKTNAFDIGVPD